MVLVKDTIPRSCPICENPMKFGNFIGNDFIKADADVNPIEYIFECKIVWNNHLLKIPCCSCYPLLALIESSKKYQVNLDIMFYINRNRNKRIVRIVMKNLKKFGMIE